MNIRTNELKTALSKIDFVSDKNNLNIQSGWVYLQTEDDFLVVKACDYTYKLTIKVQVNDTAKMNVIVPSNVFIPLISKIESEELYIEVTTNTLDITTDTGEYHIPLVVESKKPINVFSTLKVKSCTEADITGDELASIYKTNIKGFLNSTFAENIQKYTYVDNIGAITFTENIYINNFKTEIKEEFSFLLTATQAKMLNIFDKVANVHCKVNQPRDLSDYISVGLTYGTTTLEFLTTNYETVLKFPSIRLREVASNSRQSHVWVDRKKFETALTRLMIFTKDLDKTVLDYSKVVFSTDGIKLISVKNRNSEKIPYLKGTDIIEKTAIIRFEDLLNQVKVATGKELEISYGAEPAIIFNTDIIQLVPAIDKD